MKRILLFCLLILGILNSSVFAATVKVQLNDGSIVAGEIVEFNNHIYTLESKSFGRIKINESEIKEIHYKSGDGIETSQEIPLANMSSEIETMKKSMLSDEEVMNIIHSLQDDPEFQEILKDPVIMNAVQSGDINTLMSNEKFLKLLDHSSVEQIKNQMGQ